MSCSDARSQSGSSGVDQLAACAFCIHRHQLCTILSSSSVAEEITHVDIDLDYLLNLLCFGDGGSDGGCGGNGGTTSGGRASVGEELTDVLSAKSLSEKAGPVSLNRVAGGSDDLVQFLFSNFEISVVEEECSVGACEFVFLSLGEG